jgi:hypothetical protein
VSAAGGARSGGVRAIGARGVGFGLDVGVILQLALDVIDAGI